MTYEIPTNPANAERYFKKFHDSHLTPEDRAYIAGLGFDVNDGFPATKPTCFRVDLSEFGGSVGINYGAGNLTFAHIDPADFTPESLAGVLNL